MGISQEYFYPFAWTQDYIGEHINIAENPSRSDFTMTECADARNILVNKISLVDWIKQFCLCKDYALMFKGDMLPALSRYGYYIKQLFLGKRL